LLWPALQPLLGGNCGRHVLGGPARTCRSRQIIRYGMMSTGAKPRWHPSDAASVDAGAMCGRQRHQRRFGRTPLSSGLPPTADMRTSAGFRRCGPLSRHRRAEIPQCASSPAAHSRFILAAKITLLHFFTSSEISLAKSSGDPARVVPPRLASCAWSFGAAILTLTSLFSFWMTSAGVRFGPQMPYHAPKPCIARESHGLKEESAVTSRTLK